MSDPIYMHQMAPKCLTLMVLLKDLFEKVNFLQSEKSQYIQLLTSPRGGMVANDWCMHNCLCILKILNLKIYFT